MDPYTVVLTSCGRFDLLETTLVSLFPRLKGPVAQVVVVEDSGNQEIFDVVSRLGRDIQVLLNAPPLGQH